MLIDSRGRLPHTCRVSSSIRISDDLAARAKRAARVFHRSPPQQVEHWAQIGRVMEEALSYPAHAAVKQAGRAELDVVLEDVGTEAGRRRAWEVIGRTAGSSESAD